MKTAIRLIIAVGLLALAFDAAMLVLIQYESQRARHALESAEASLNSFLQK